MKILFAVLLGIIQGVTEFLPVSSSGHLILFQELFGYEAPLFFDIMLHVGSLCAVCTVFWQDIKEVFCHPLGRTARLLIVATLPTVAVVLLIKLIAGDAPFYGRYLYLGFLCTAAALFIFEKLPRGQKSFEDLRARDAVVMGLFQGAGTLPGVSRSGITLFGAGAVSLDRESGARFAFLMSVPAILGALVLDIPQVIEAGSIGVGWLEMLAGFIASAAAGYFSIKWLLRVITGKSLRGFALYTLLLGLALLLARIIWGWG